MRRVLQINQIKIKTQNKINHAADIMQDINSVLDGISTRPYYAGDLYVGFLANQQASMHCNKEVLSLQPTMIPSTKRFYILPP